MKTQQFGDRPGLFGASWSIDVGFVRPPQLRGSGYLAGHPARPALGRVAMGAPAFESRPGLAPVDGLSHMVRDRPVIPPSGGGGRFRNLFSESLILAQDERWRRA